MIIVIMKIIILWKWNEIMIIMKKMKINNNE